MDNKWPAFESKTGLAPARGVSLRRFSSLGIGGLAGGAITVDDDRTLRTVVRTAGEIGIPVKILGGGTNLVFTDDGFSGLLVRLGEQFKKIEISGDRVLSGASVPLPALITRTMESGLSGLEKLTGIPGTLGGAIYQNSGARDYETARAVASVTFFDAGRDEIVTLPADRLEFGYRSSGFHRRRAAILSAELRLTPAPREEIMAEVTARMKYRNSTQPPGRSVGCIFKNPPDKSAGRLIDEAGLKGRSVGGLTISGLHGNFFLNDGRATFRDFEELVAIARETVKNKFGIDLELEVEIVREIQNAADDGPIQNGKSVAGRRDAENRPFRRWKISGEGNFI